MNKVSFFIEKLENLTSKQVVLEEADVKYEYGCAMLQFESETIKNIQENINKKDLYSLPGFGLEKKHHLTLLYGFHPKEPTLYKKIIKFIAKYKIPDLYLFNISSFSNDDYDVLKFECRTYTGKGIYSKKDDNIFKINNDLKNSFSYTSDFDTYLPHSTIAYLKPGMAKKYIKKFKEVYSIEKPTKIIYSEPSKIGNKIFYFKLC